MSITDRTRKLLWGHSGNRCALCVRELTEPSTSDDPAAVIGDECHLISPAAVGPRYDPTFAGDHDGEDNLILLCKSDHKRIDDQPGAFSVEKLKQLKANHAASVRSAVRAAFPSSPTDVEEPAYDNFRTGIWFLPGQAEEDLERFQQRLIKDPRLVRYARVGIGFGGTPTSRTHSWLQAFLPVSEELLRTIADEVGVHVHRVTQEREPGIYRGIIPNWAG